MVKTDEEKLAEKEALLDEMIQDRMNKYRSVQDFSVDHFETERVMAALAKMSTNIKRKQTEVDNLKRELGYTEAQISRERKDRRRY